MSAETPRYTLWLDCEFTGLSAEDDLLLEVGAIVTEGLFDEVDSYEAVVAQNPLAVAVRMSQDKWWPSRPDHRDKMMSDIEQSTKSLETVDGELAGFAGQYVTNGIVPAGNSPTTDRQFISRDLPQFNNLLHYRTIDVSSFKEVARRLGIEEYQKTEQHRVLADARESIQELEYLLKKLGSPATRHLIENR